MHIRSSFLLPAVPGSRDESLRTAIRHAADTDPGDLDIRFPKLRIFHDGSLLVAMQLS